MTLKINHAIVAVANRRPRGWWEVTNWPRFYDRKHAITALTVTELLETCRDSNDPLLAALREEMR